MVSDALLEGHASRRRHDLEWLVRRASSIEDAHDAVDPLSERPDILVTTLALWVEVEVDLGLVAWVRGPQPDVAILLFALHVNDGEEQGLLRRASAAEARIVTVEHSGSAAKDNEVRISRLSLASAKKHEDRRRALPVRSIPFKPLGEAWVLIGCSVGVEEAPGRGVVLPRDGGIDVNASLVVVTEVFAL